MTLRVTFVSERTTMAVTSLTTGNSSSSESRFGRTTTSNSGRCWRRLTALAETGSQTSTFIKRASLGPGYEAVKNPHRRDLEISTKKRRGAGRLGGWEKEFPVGMKRPTRPTPVSSPQSPDLRQQEFLRILARIIAASPKQRGLRIGPRALGGSL